jgi:hypothetical protein
VDSNCPEFLEIFWRGISGVFQADGSVDVPLDDVPGLISVGRPFLARLEAWRTNLPKELGMGSTRLRKLCSNGSTQEGVSNS